MTPPIAPLALVHTQLIPSTTTGPRRAGVLALTLFLTTMAALRAAQEPALIPVGVTWRFLAATSNPSDPLTAWRTADFDDSAWASGPAGFSLAGDEATLLPSGASATVYFRKTFTVTDPAAVRWLVLRVDYADGFAAYLNGQPVARRGLPADEPLAFGTLAAAHARGETEEFNLSDFTSLLVAGTNVLAIDLHPHTVPPPWYVLVPELRANFSRGPVARNISTNGAEIAWRTPVPTVGVVEYGATEVLGLEATGTAAASSHALRLAGLPPDTEWFYRVRSTDGGGEAISPIASLHTARAAGELTFGVVGDSGGGQVPLYQVAACLATSRVDLVVHVGDVVYPLFTDAQADARCHSVYEAHRRSTPYYFVFGNHDLYSGSDVPFLDSFEPPTNSVTGTGHFYSFDQGDVHFVCLFVPTLANPGGTAAYGLAPGSAQWQWLTNDLTTTTKPWKLLFLHSPLFTSSVHRFDDYNANGIPDRFELQSMLLPIAAQHGVQAIFSGHDHCYERFAPTNSVHCFVSGGGGVNLYGLYQLDAQSAYFASRFHHLRAAVAGEHLVLEAWDNWGARFDRVVIPRGSLGLQVARRGPNSLRLTWAARPGAVYELEATSSLEGPFAPLSAPSLPRTATGVEEHFDFELTAGDPPAQFFRVRALPPPVN